MLTNEELVDSLIVDCNNAVRSCVCGEYVAFCSTVVQMVQKLSNLKVGIASDMKNREENIAMLEKRLADLGHPVEKVSAQELLKGGKEND